MAPLPRAFQWADGSAYVNHVELVRKARNAEMPASFWEDPLMYQGGSDDFIGPCDDIELKHEEWGIDFESEIAVITDDVPMGATPDQAYQQIRPSSVRSTSRSISSAARNPNPQLSRKPAVRKTLLQTTLVCLTNTYLTLVIPSSFNSLMGLPT